MYVAGQVISLSEQGEQGGLATAIFEHAGSTVALAGALYVAHKYTEAAEAYKKALEVRGKGGGHAVTRMKQLPWG